MLLTHLMHLSIELLKASVCLIQHRVMFVDDSLLYLKSVGL
jgi:hypothetical protein